MILKFNKSGLLGLMIGLAACQQPTVNTVEGSSCRVNLFVLGNGQDAGKPQIGLHDDPAWQDPALIAPATSIAVNDQDTGANYLFDATPDIKAQMYALDKYTNGGGFRLDGVFLTHGHMGHYLGLAQLGREAMGAKSVPVYAMPKMAGFLETNGPWDLLVRLENIKIVPQSDQIPITLSPNISVTPFVVPHRGEYTETVGYKIQGPGKSAIYLPDIDSWEAWSTPIEDVITTNDLLFLDGSFYSGDELPGRDMSKIPHPTIIHSMQRLKDLTAPQRAKIRFIHLNHSNPAHDEHTNAYEDIEKAGYAIAQTGERHCLD